MRKCVCVPMIVLCLLLTGCGEGANETDLRRAYREMAGCIMEAEVSCDQEGLIWEAGLRCEYIPGGESAVEVLEPQTIAGVRMRFCDEDWQLEYEDQILNAGALSQEGISPALCLPRLMNALREGWLLEKNEETWRDIPCLRLTLDQSGEQGGKILSTVWLRMDSGTPLRGEVTVDDEIILTAEFTSFAFYDKITK